jgi:23S rRNA pseudouridine1911/1915/1917 synthase
VTPAIFVYHPKVVHPQQFRFYITPAEGGRRLDEFLAAQLGGLSRMRIAALLESGACLVNRIAAPAGYHLTPGDHIELTFDDATPTAMSPEPIPLEILHEDDHLVVVVKPAGMLVHPTRSVKTGTLLNGLAYHLNRLRIEESGFALNSGSQSNTEPEESPGRNPSVIRPGLVHRLDRATSGLMVVAKTQRALSVLSVHFHRRLVEKRYVALVHGNPEYVSLEIDAPIGRDPDRRPRWWVRDSGRPARTRVEVRERFGDRTLVELEPVTGRTNQLRIHCAYGGHPIVGDEMYGGLGVSNGDGLSEEESKPYLGSRGLRLCLHAWRLAFHHPVGGGWVEFRTSLPGDWPTDSSYATVGVTPSA